MQLCDSEGKVLCLCDSLVIKSFPFHDLLQIPKPIYRCFVLNVLLLSFLVANCSALLHRLTCVICTDGYSLKLLTVDFE